MTADGAKEGALTADGAGEGALTADEGVRPPEQAQKRGHGRQAQRGEPPLNRRRRPPAPLLTLARRQPPFLKPPKHGEGIEIVRLSAIVAGGMMCFPVVR